jgi:putative membrane protein
MNDGYSNYGMGGGNWWWMSIMMFAILGGLIWIGITLVRHGNHTPHPQTPGAPTPPARQTPQELLAERLARGEIEPDDYRQRLDALNHRPNEN